jgi:hypothetical protein
LAAGPLTVARFRSAAPLAVAVLLLAVVTGACSDDDGTAGATPETTAAPAAEVLASTTTTAAEPVGEQVTRYSLNAGDCFNVYDALNVITRVPCDQPHDREVFHTDRHPAPFGEPFPGDRAMQRFATDLCYRHFEAFNGGIYEVSALQLGAFTPTQQNFEDAKARYRGITCFVYQSGSQLTGSMRGLAR